ncbi:hypothetical protein ACIF6L_38435 [Kitasatospora sp. NPDC086009]|uniref:hypothetical protein n=1 Tax=Kitasatospora sp. NPDC086009 TaxID=3364065 RepID=UPI0037C9C045
MGERLSGIVVHDFEELGVPDGADRIWRNRTTEMWVCRALEYQRRGLDLVLTGQSPLGEVLAVPSAPLLEGIAVCLVDVSDKIRRRRLTERDPGRWDTPANGQAEEINIPIGGRSVGQTAPIKVITCDSISVDGQTINPPTVSGFL